MSKLLRHLIILMLLFNSRTILGNLGKRTIKLRPVFNPQTYKQRYTPTVVEGGVGWDLPVGFRYVTIFRKDFTLSRKPMTGCRAAGGLCRHPRWPPFWASSWISRRN